MLNLMNLIICKGQFKGYSLELFILVHVLLSGDIELSLCSDYILALKMYSKKD